MPNTACTVTWLPSRVPPGTVALAIMPHLGIARFGANTACRRDNAASTPMLRYEHNSMLTPTTARRPTWLHSIGCYPNSMACYAVKTLGCGLAWLHVYNAAATSNGSVWRHGGNTLLHCCQSRPQSVIARSDTNMRQTANHGCLYNNNHTRTLLGFAPTRQTAGHGCLRNHAHGQMAGVENTTCCHSTAALARRHTRRHGSAWN